MYEEIKSYGIKLEEFKDIKKAYELIKENYKLIIIFDYGIIYW